MKKLLIIILAFCLSLSIFAGVSVIVRSKYLPQDDITSSSKDSSSDSGSSSSSSSSSSSGIDLPWVPLN